MEWIQYGLSAEALHGEVTEEVAGFNVGTHAQRHSDGNDIIALNDLSERDGLKVFINIPAADRGGDGITVQGDSTLFRILQSEADVIKLRLAFYRIAEGEGMILGGVKNNISPVYASALLSES